METQLWFDDIEVGAEAENGEEVADFAEMLEYAKRNDPFPVHLSDDAARAAGFDGVIASFGYTVSLWFRLIHDNPLNRSCRDAFIAAVGWNVAFRGAVRGGDRLRLRLEILSTRRASAGDRGVVVTRCTMRNHNGAEVVVIDVTSLVRARVT